MANERVRCSKRVMGIGRYASFHSHQCTRAAKVERDGRPYCGQHDPVAVAAKEAAEKVREDRIVKARIDALPDCDIEGCKMLVTGSVPVFFELESLYAALGVAPTREEPK